MSGEGNRGLENALRAKPLEVKEHCEKQLLKLQEACGDHAETACLTKAFVAAESKHGAHALTIEIYSDELAKLKRRCHE